MGRKKQRRNESVLDEAYLVYADSDPFLPVTHFIEHATMGAEALVELGLGDRVKQWLSHHRVRPYQAPIRGIAMATDWRRALGRQDCHGDWIRHLEAELTSRAYQDVLAEWTPRLAHQVGAHLFHGLIRTGHAVRALEHADTHARRAELARGLALWAIGIHDAPSEGAPPAATGAESQPEIIDCARLGAATFICDPNVPNLHLVTGPMAYRMIAHLLDDRTHAIARASFGATHRQAAARFASIEQRAYAEPGVTLPLAPDSAHMEALAAQSDAHPSKLTDAALRAYAETKDEIFLKAAAKALDLHGLRALFGVVKAMISRRVA